MRAVQCFTVYTYKIEQNGALQFKNNGEKYNGEKYQYPYIKHTHLSKTAHSLAPFKANTDVPQTSYWTKIDMSQANFRKANVIPPLYPFMHEHTTIGGGNGSYWCGNK